MLGASSIATQRELIRGIPETGTHPFLIPYTAGSFSNAEFVGTDDFRNIFCVLVLKIRFMVSNKSDPMQHVSMRNGRDTQWATGESSGSIAKGRPWSTVWKF